MKVSLNVREHVTRKYRKAKSTEPAGTICVLRYGNTFETIDAENWNDARVAQLRKSAALLEGWRPKVEKKKPAGLMLDAAMDQYLSEVKAGRKKKTYQAYDTALRYFYECIGNKPIKEITRGDLIRFAAWLRKEKENSPRSCWNKFSNVMSFLKHHDVKPKIKPHDWPQYVEEEPEIYEQETLDQFFSACTDDEPLLFEFFLMTGMREQEAIYATDRSLDFSNCTVSVKHNPEYHWTPKAYKPGSPHRRHEKSLQTKKILEVNVIETKQRHDIGFTMKRTTTVVDNRGDLVIDSVCMVVIDIVHDGVCVQAGVVNVLHNCRASVSEFV